MYDRDPDCPAVRVDGSVQIHRLLRLKLIEL